MRTTSIFVFLGALVAMSAGLEINSDYEGNIPLPELIRELELEWGSNDMANPYP
ncbi:Uu.00g049110.m01.CDS01 [Anthostomella pinea]|uniref:Uu.00g049110.m01.CDS01 n=1 Tax=Anthostomella pinea TaxID=933095 RepID=A0AAI8V6U0_9PEZI|nr:Uu.00g049110.m01.CDS01 [Anthostomella pinea]